MQTQSIQSNAISQPLALTDETPSIEGLNQVLLVNSLSSIDAQIKDISAGIKGEMQQKDGLRAQLSILNELAYQPKITLEDGTSGIELTPAQAASVTTISGGNLIPKTENGSQYITPEQLSGLKDSVSEKLQDLNSGWELRSIELQSLMDQRKNMITMVSNLMATNHETLSAIVRNLKA